MLGILFSTCSPMLPRTRFLNVTIAYSNIICLFVVGTGCKFLVSNNAAIISAAIIIQLVTTVSLILKPLAKVIIHCVYFTYLTSFLWIFDISSFLIKITILV